MCVYMLRDLTINNHLLDHTLMRLILRPGSRQHRCHSRVDKTISSRYLVLDAKYVRRGSVRWLQAIQRAPDATGIRQRWRKKPILYVVRQWLAPLRAKRRNFPSPPPPRHVVWLTVAWSHVALEPHRAASSRTPPTAKLVPELLPHPSSFCPRHPPPLCPCRLKLRMRERERTREIERDFPPSACCPREAIRRGQEKKK
jgi:hypothetical protein